MKQILPLLFIFLVLGEQSIREKELNALSVIYQSMGGISWVKNDGWMENDNYCQWHGISCLESDHSVSRIILQYNGLRFSLPAEIKDFQFLTHLDLSGNEIVEVSGEIGLLPVLQLLVLRKNLISHLPKEIGNLTVLTVLNVQENLIKEVPEEFRGMKKLEILRLGGNQIEEIPRKIGMMVNITDLDLHDNRISEVPSEIGRLTRLVHLDLMQNHISSLPPEIRYLSRLRELNLRHNQLDEIPPDIGYMGELMDLDLGYNNVEEIPKQMGNITSLIRLSMGFNRVGVIPEEFSMLSNLQHIDFSSNKLIEIPSMISSLTNLTTILMPNNRITKISPQIGLLKHLGFLDLSENQIQNIPIELGSLVSLTQLDLSFNDIRKLPLELRNMKTVFNLILTSNSIEELPPIFSSLTLLTNLYLGSNLLINVTSDFKMLTNLMVLDLSNNRIQVFPSEITSLSSLSKLDLSKNLNIEKIPREIGALTQLLQFSMHSNNISIIPPELALLKDMYFLDFSNNHIHSIPEEIAGLTSLSRLNLSSNLIDTIPNAVMGLSMMSDLDLSFNEITVLPEQMITKMLKLSHLRLTGNYIERVTFSDLGVNPFITILLNNNKLKLLRYLNEINLRDSFHIIDISENPDLVLIDGVGFSGKIYCSKIDSEFIITSRFYNSAYSSSFDIRDCLNVNFEELVPTEDVIVPNRDTINLNCFAPSSFLTNYEIIGFPGRLLSHRDFCWCSTGSVGIVPTCIPCGTYGDVICNDSVIFFEDTWPVSENNTLLGFTPCKVKNSCIASSIDLVFNQTQDICRQGHEGRLCYKCQLNHYRGIADNLCYSCGAVDIPKFLLVLLGIAVIVIFILVIKEKIEFLIKYDLGIIFSALFFAQTMLAVIPLDNIETSDSNTTIPSLIFTSVYQFLYLDIPHKDCFMYWITENLFVLNSWKMFLLDMMIPLAMCIIFTTLTVLKFLIKYLLRRFKSSHEVHISSESKLSVQIIHIFDYVFYISFFSISIEIFETMSCTQDLHDRMYYLSAKPWIMCSFEDAEYGPQLILGLIFLFVYIGIYIARIIINLCKLKSKNRFDEHIIDLYGFLYTHYKHEKYWYEIIWMIRRLTISMILVFVPEEFTLPTLITSLLIFSTIHHRTFPFETKAENNIELLSFIVLTSVTAYLITGKTYLFNSIHILYVLQSMSILFLLVCTTTWLSKKILRLRKKTSLDELQQLLD